MEKKDPPPRFDRFHGFQPWKKENFDVKKKRKLQDDQLTVPTPKLPFSWDLDFPSKGNFKFGRIPEEEEEEVEEEANLMKKVKEYPAMIDVNEMPKEEVQSESEGKSIGYGHEEDLFEFGIHGNSSKEQNCSKNAPGLLQHEFVLSSGRWKVNPVPTAMRKKTFWSLEAIGTAAMLLKAYAYPENPRMNFFCLLGDGMYTQEDLLEFRRHGNRSIEQHCSNGAEGLLLPKESKHEFVLSSGRWKIDPGAESNAVKPTIDQEFEQYFSVLGPRSDTDS